MESGIDLHGWEKSLESAKRDLKRSSISKKDKELILRFSNFKRISDNVGAGRRTRYVHNMMLFAEKLHDLTGKILETATREDIERLVTDFYENSEEWNRRQKKKLGEGSMRLYLVILKTFYAWLKREKNPEITSWIRPPRPQSKKLKPDDIITWEDAVRLSRAAFNHRDKALPLVLWESGVRIGELLSMSIEDVEMLDNGTILHIFESKTEKRDVGIKKSVPALGDWLQNHPLRGNPGAPLWVNLGGNHKRASDGLVRRILANEAGRARLDKNVNPHRFRKSTASIFATNGMFSEAELKRRMGWTPDSKMLGIYVHMDDHRINQKYLNSEQEGISCMWCNAVNSPAETYCRTCTRPLNDDTMQRKNELEHLIEELIERKLNAFS